MVVTRKRRAVARGDPGTDLGLGDDHAGMPLGRERGTSRLDGTEFRRNEYPDTCTSCGERIFPGDGYLLGRRSGTWNVVCAPPEVPRM